jgi:hypothetical protein
MVMKVVDGMTYIHTEHPIREREEVQSFYRLHADEGVREYAKIIKELKEYLYEHTTDTGSVQSGRQKSVSETSNWSGSGRSGRSVLQEPGGDNNKKDLLTD